MRTTVKVTDTPSSFNCDSLVVPIFNDRKLSTSARSVDAANNRQLSQLLRSDEFSGTLEETLPLFTSTSSGPNKILLWGLGDKSELNTQKWLSACKTLGSAVQKLKGSHIAVLGGLKFPRGLKADEAWQQLSAQLTRSSYRYDTTLSKPKRAEAKKLTLLSADTDPTLRKAARQGNAIGEGINTARELGNLPGNICTPKYLSSEARKLGRKHDNLSVKILGERAMQELGMGSLLSVGHGSDQESQFIIMDYRGGKKSEKPQVLVGKGITFDTGGISLKPGGKMDEMKFDMCGAASVMGTMQAIATMKLSLNVIGVIAAAENMPSGRATKPGDVVTSMSGKTIEVLNTDAEGRLVLCDALTYVKRFKPASVVDMATLTGACIVALGHHASGLMSNDDALAEQLLAAGSQSGDRAWRLPIWDDYHKQLKSPFADLANIGGPSAGTITAACFLANFAEDYPWAHLDIAGTAWNQGEGKGASGRPVSLLCQYLINCV